MIAWLRRTTKTKTQRRQRAPRQRQLQRAIEALEPRRLLASDLGFAATAGASVVSESGIVTVDFPDDASNVKLFREGDDVVVSDRGSLEEISRVPTSTFTELIVNGRDDYFSSLFIDLADGDPLNGKQLTFNAGDNGNGRIWLTNAPEIPAAFTFKNIEDGSVEIGTLDLHYFGLNPVNSKSSYSSILLTGALTDLTLGYGQDSETIDVTLASLTVGDSGPGFQVESSSGTQLNVLATVQSFSIDSGGGDDTINFVAGRWHVAETLVVDGGDGIDAIHIADQFKTGNPVGLYSEMLSVDPLASLKPVDTLGGTYNGKAGDTILLIENDGKDQINGLFADTQENSLVNFDGDVYTLSYVGGDGNDLELAFLRNLGEFIDPNPSPRNGFGANIVPLATGNVVITSSRDDKGGTDAGAVYLFNGSTGELISTLIGSSPDDRIGDFGVTVLEGGNFMVRSSLWDNGDITDAGAVTWGNGIVGVSGSVSPANSLVGTSANDRVGLSEVTSLENGNYVILHLRWDNGTMADAGAVTFFQGDTGIAGAISEHNSLVGQSTNDQVGYRGVLVLENGNFVVSSPGWDNGPLADVGAVTFGDGMTGVAGTITVANSLIGRTYGDSVGSVQSLSNGNYVVTSPGWDNGSILDVGAATWGSGETGVTGLVSSVNSLVGANTDDQIGSDGVVGLANGNYVVNSSNWNSGDQYNAGAVTWGDGALGKVGTVSQQNSLVGSTFDDRVGSSGIVALPSGNYLVHSVYWNNGRILRAGAVTFGDGTKGVLGVVSEKNSLVGGTYADSIGSGEIVILDNGNYVVQSPFWDYGTVRGAGAITWGSGATGVVGAISTENSIVGVSQDDRVGGYYGVTPLKDGNYVFGVPGWDNENTIDVGAVRFVDGNKGTAGVISAENSLIGSSYRDNVGSYVVALDNGNYVVASPNWDNGAVENAGAVTLASGTVGITGVVSISNSLFGTTQDDSVGGTGVIALVAGNYVVVTADWDNGAIPDVGAVTFANGEVGAIGPVSENNSLIGNSEDDAVGSSMELNGNRYSTVIAAEDGSYIVLSDSYDSETRSDFGAITFGDKVNGVNGVINSQNSYLGSVWRDDWYEPRRLHLLRVTPLLGGSYLLENSDLDNGYGDPYGVVPGVWTPRSQAVSEAMGEYSHFNRIPYLDVKRAVVDRVNNKVYGPLNNLTFGNGYDWTEHYRVQVMPVPTHEQNPALTINAVRGGVDEGDAKSTPMHFLVTRTGGVSSPAAVNFTVTPYGQEAASPSDFENKRLPTGTVNFIVGETSKLVTLVISGDSSFEPDETFQVSLSNATGGAIIETASAIGTIRNDDRERRVLVPAQVAGLHVVPGDNIPTAIIFQAISDTVVSVNPVGSASATETIRILDGDLQPISRFDRGVVTATVNAGGLYAVVFDPQSRERIYSIRSSAGAAALNGVSATNILEPTDTTGDGETTALDALAVINALHRQSDVAESEQVGVTPGLFLDVNRDGSVTALDVLHVINHLSRSENSVGQSSRELESILVPISATNGSVFAMSLDEESVEEVLNSDRFNRAARLSTGNVDDVLRGYSLTDDGSEEAAASDQVAFPVGLSSVNKRMDLGEEVFTELADQG